MCVKSFKKEVILERCFCLTHVSVDVRLFEEPFKIDFREENVKKSGKLLKKVWMFYKLLFNDHFSYSKHCYCYLLNTVFISLFLKRPAYN